MIKTTEKDIDERYTQIYRGLLSNYQKSLPKNQPTHYTISKGESGFDDVKYYRLN